MPLELGLNHFYTLAKPREVSVLTVKEGQEPRILLSFRCHIPRHQEHVNEPNYLQG